MRSVARYGGEGLLRDALARDVWEAVEGGLRREDILSALEGLWRCVADQSDQEVNKVERRRIKRARQKEARAAQARGTEEYQLPPLFADGDDDMGWPATGRAPPPRERDGRRSPLCSPRSGQSEWETSPEPQPITTQPPQWRGWSNEKQRTEGSSGDATGDANGEAK
eukprot:gene29727-1890_t